MNKIAVNPTLFITCRLCLEELGLYQIVPNVKDQIAYCFGITIEPFDGLPQLICEKCEKVLSNFTNTKKKFIDKQTELRTKIYNAKPHVEESPSSQKTTEESQQKPQVIEKRKESNKSSVSDSKKRKSRVSSSSSNQEFNRSKSIVNHTEQNSFCKEDVEDYTKQYVCKICSSRWSNVNFVLNHVNTKHGHIFKRYGLIFKRHCQVKLNKIDGDEISNKIMLTKGKVIQNVHANYYIIYTSRNYKDNQSNETRKRKSANGNKSKYQFSSDSSDDEVFVKRKRSKRICSRSSNDTVVLENNSDKEKEFLKSERNSRPPSEYDACIDLGDSSETESEKSVNAYDEKIQKQSLNIDHRQLKGNKSIVKEIISSCGNKYSKKHYQDSLSIKSSKNPSDIATHLKRKILSIGRKIINKKIRVNSVPLLRFLDHKSLDLSWIPRDVLNLNQDSNYIRILPRIKHVGEKSHSETGWTYCTSVQIDDEESLIQSTNKPHEIAAQSFINEFKGIDIQSVSSGCAPEMALISDSITISTEIKKLLNANPVANPKQLPKKCVTNELKATKTAPKAADVASQENNDPEYYMPIITHTTSLALPFIPANDLNNKPEISSVKTDDQKSEAPRIKVKPASELMSAETLNRMQSPKPIQYMIGQTVALQNQKNLINVYIPVGTSGPPRENILQSPTTNGGTSSVVSEAVWQNEFMILDTVELPNTRTNSPFLYFRNLLQIHNIILLDTHAELNESFHCLIKFKVVYKQDSKNQPVVLCLALFCAHNIFCFKVKDRHQENIDLTKITPNWQWEVLKIYKGEVVNKLLNNAQKIGTDVYEFTNKFMCLLKSIVLVRTA